MKKIKVFDGYLGDVDVRISGLGSIPGVRFTGPRGFGVCFHISDKESAKKLRKMPKPLAKS